ncbi:G-type lectin S-receptor-like serine/threonine-protein kinase B120 [Triticum dicoccoides]|uniref:G-type lectin S-receptor-like serine/threonine-protein kinase B120 n=1 Tax=Triticum dicoccoides TaxID=85692 RepID=UPI00188E2DCE|nr:G-type lectin S-receptor-like serine/threonine-protein kinase B120 [Triticum dicoccoides]
MARATSAALALLIFLLCRHVHADAGTTLSQGQSLAGNDKLLSANGAFSLSFFSPRGGDGSRMYLGVMFAKAAEPTVPWVANRDAPVSATASSYSATVTDSGDLRVMEGERVVWQTNTTSSAGNFTLTIQDTGNLVLAGGSGAQAVHLWQSFDYPADTFLPGMNITLARRGGAVVRQTLFRSWRSPDDPAPGNFTLGQDPLGSSQLFIWRRSEDGKDVTHWRSGQWAKGSFVGIPYRPLNGLYGFQLSGDPSQSNGLYYTFQRFNSSQYRFVLQPNGTETCYQLVDATGAWEVVWSQPTLPCQAYNTCGPNAECSAADHCTCLRGFEPKSEAEYGSGVWAQGCVRSSQLTCSERNVSMSGGDAFAVLSGVKLPDLAAWESAVISADACRQWCLANCTCNAYSYSGGTGCLTWAHELLDIYQFPSGQFPNGQGYDLHIKVPASALGSGSKRRTRIIVSVVIVLAVVLAACGFLMWKCRRRIRDKLGVGGGKKRTGAALMLRPATMKAKHDFSGPKQPDQEVAENGDGCELPMFTLETLAAATGGFSEANKLGEGGFGLVYKGSLPGGEEVAVKRLSRSSGQGCQEFKNEVTLISELQHRNLVRILGCCIHGHEKMLVYEYMPNKSLDAFLFDPARRGLLDWKTRLHIIEGIARGLLYLHRDSRLRVVHRDLKASNILLDHEMNPKISDFGMARIFGGDKNQENTNRVVGTLGYMSPEYAMEGLFSVRSDVYSFGILILEIITGQKNSSFHNMEGSLNIVGYAWQMWNSDKGEQLIDPLIRASSSASASREALRCVHMALLCVQDHAGDRPDIPYVVLALGSDSSVLPMPRPPTFTLQCTSSDRDGFRGKAGDESYSACDLTVTVLQGR